LSDSNVPASHCPEPPPPEAEAIAPAWQIRPARRSDLEALADLLASSFHSREGLGKWVYPMFRTALQEDLRGRLNNGGQYYRCLVAVHSVSPTAGTPSSPPPTGEAILGTVEIGLKPQFHLPWYCWFKLFPYISNLAIAPAFRRQGIAADLLQACEPIAQQWEYQDLYLHVLENNQAARALYKKVGFRVCQVESSLSTVLLGRPRQFLLHKGLPASKAARTKQTGYLPQS